MATNVIIGKGLTDWPQSFGYSSRQNKSDIWYVIFGQIEQIFEHFVNE